MPSFTGVSLPCSRDNSAITRQQGERGEKAQVRLYRTRNLPIPPRPRLTAPGGYADEAGEVGLREAEQLQLGTQIRTEHAFCSTSHGTMLQAPSTSAIVRSSRTSSNSGTAGVSEVASMTDKLKLASSRPLYSAQYEILSGAGRDYGRGADGAEEGPAAAPTPKPGRNLHPRGSHQEWCGPGEVKPYSGPLMAALLLSVLYLIKDIIIYRM